MYRIAVVHQRDGTASDSIRTSWVDRDPPSVVAIGKPAKLRDGAYSVSAYRQVTELVVRGDRRVNRRYLARCKEMRHENLESHRLRCNLQNTRRWPRYESTSVENNPRPPWGRHTSGMLWENRYRLSHSISSHRVARSLCSALAGPRWHEQANTRNRPSKEGRRSPCVCAWLPSRDAQESIVRA